MKKRYLNIAAVICVFIFVNISFAAEKIGYVKFQEVVANSEAGKAMAAEIRKSMEKDMAGLKDRENELKKMKEAIDSGRNALKPEIIQQKEALFDRKLREYQVFSNDFKNEVTQKEQAMFRKLIPEIVKIVRAIAEKENYTLIMDPVVTQLPYYAPGGDLTDRVLQEFNKVQK